MQFQLSFGALLAGVLVALSAQDAEATPITKRNTGMITLPLKRVERSDVHPLILLHRAERRLARMTGREMPSDLELREKLERRMSSLDEGLAKRFNRQGLPKPRDLHNARDPLAAVGLRRKKGQGGQGAGNAAGAGAGAGAGAAGAGAAGAGAAGTGSAASSGSASGASPNLVTNSNPPTDSNSLALDIEGQDISYLATVQIGTPPTDFLILMDSGSSDFWVGSENCSTIATQAGGQNQPGCGNHKFLGTQSSSSFTDTQQPFQVTYGTGQVAGDIIQDNVVLAGLSLNNHTFGVATQESIDFSGANVPFDGLMGLAKSALSQQQTLTPPESLAQQGLIAQAIVSYKIPRLADNKLDGEITFGGLDQTKFNPNSLVTFNNVNQQGFWEGALDAITVDGQDSGLTGRTAILDTGTTLIIAPSADASAVHQLISGATQDAQNGFTVPCQTNASVALTFSGTAFTIDPRDIAVQPPLANGNCVSGIQAGNVGGATEWLVGDVFLKNAYFSTNVNQNTISLANLV